MLISVMKNRCILLPVLLASSLVLLSSSCQESSPSNEVQVHALKRVFNSKFLIGAALNRHQIFGKRPGDMTVVIKHYNTLTPENILKWERVHPEPNKYNFKSADRFVNLGEHNNMFMVGHTLVWHNQTPDWVFENPEGRPLSKEKLLKRMRDHINQIMKRYKGRIHGWDVVNEALNEDGSYRQSPWYKILGKTYIDEAFQAARKADPDAELYYNDYNLWKPYKRKGTVRLINRLQSNGIDVDGIGMQGHWNLSHPPIEQIEESILAFHKTGVNVMITELDVDVLPNQGSLTAEVKKSEGQQTHLDPYQNNLPDSTQTQLANRYKQIFKILQKHSDKISRVTFWGVNDRQSWRNNWPIRGRTNYPLLFDRQNQPKEAFEEVIKLRHASKNVL